MPNKKAPADKMPAELEREIELEELLLNHPKTLSAEDGIKKAKEWLAILKRHEKNIRTGDHISNEEAREQGLIEIGRDIRKAQSVLKQFQTQFEGRN